MNKNIFLQKNKKLFLNKYTVMAADFETTPIKIGAIQKHFVYAWSIYGDNTIKPITKIYQDPLKEEKIIEEFLQHIIMISLNKKIKIYMHNLGSFDGYFIIRAIKNIKDINLTKVNVIIRHNSFYKISIGNITFLDSYKILPEKLDNLCIKFGLSQHKNIIDHEEINVNTIKKNYALIKKYIEKDVTSLHTIITEFRKEVLSEYPQLDVFNYTTLSSISYSMFRNYYMKEEISNSFNFNSEIEAIIRQSYRGGITELYKPKIESNQKCYYYDINSSYPNAMLNFMPVGLPEIVNLNNFNLKNFFGFIKCIIKVKDTYAPFIGVRNKESIIYPTGHFSISIFSEELKFAISIQQVEIIKITMAISFKKEKIFKKFVEKNYSMRERKGNSYIYKIILNSLYGRFALKKEKQLTDIISIQDFTYYQMIFSDVKTLTELPDNKLLISFTDTKSISQIIKKFYLSEDEKEKIKEINRIYYRKEFNYISAVQLSSAIISYARIELYKLIHSALEAKNDIYYVDTDSIITNHVYTTGKSLGQLKLIGEINEGVFLAPKIYCIKFVDGKTMLKFKGLNEISKRINFTNPIECFKEIFDNKNKDHNMKLKLLEKSPVKKNFNKMSIFKIDKHIYPTLTLKKRNKIFCKDGKWVNTSPININND